MAISEPYELDGVTVTSSGISIPSGTSTPSSITDDGVYQIWVDGCADMAKADDYLVTLLEKVEGTGGTQRTFLSGGLLGTQAEPMVSPTFILINGWDAIIDKIAGADNAFDASIRKVA